MKLTIAEENYLKCIYMLYLNTQGSVSTNAIAAHMETKPASVTDMIQKLSDKGYIKYEKYRGAKLNETGLKLATDLIRKHRLWETFLVDKLDFSWEEVHDIAEQLEHIQSNKLIDRLDEFLSFPKYDPHGDPIPDKYGKITLRNQIGLRSLTPDERGVFVGVKQHESAFLKYLNEIALGIGDTIQMVQTNDYDESMEVIINQERNMVLSDKVASKILVQKVIR